MKMNQVIVQRRKSLGLTQEQVAQYLNVSTPAVSKWETGATTPDIALLSPLARLLKTDVNTLLCFQADITPQEISALCQAIADAVAKQGIAAGFEAAQAHLHAYPHNETLLHSVTVQLDSLLTLSGAEDDTSMRKWDEKLEAWYHRLAQSDDEKLRNSALYMMACRYLRRGEDEKAQSVIDQLPDRKELAGSVADKLFIQVNLYLHQGKADMAAQMLQGALLEAVNRVQMLLLKLLDAEWAAGEHQRAGQIAQKTREMASLMDLWPYNAYVAPLQIAAAEKDAPACMALLTDLFDAMLAPWKREESPLFCRIPPSTGGISAKQMLHALLTLMERDPEYGFLRTREDFKALVEKYEHRAGCVSEGSDRE